jgi:hypothetical protein
MLSEYDVSIKYTKCTTTVTTYDTGIKDWDNLESYYRNNSIRNKVVCRADVMQLLECYFEMETIKKYRYVLMLIMKGQVKDPKQFSGCIKDFMSMDKKFRSAIQDIYNSCPEEQSFGYHIMQVLADVLINAESSYRGFFRGKPEVVICVSDGYLYFSVEDSNSKPLLPNRIDCEVLSYAKNWNGEFQYIE